jgi:hypothetical protein
MITMTHSIRYVAAALSGGALMEYGINTAFPVG